MKMLKNKIGDLIKKSDFSVGLILKDNKTGEIIKHNQDLVFPSASIIKLHILELIKSEDMSKKIPLIQEVKVSGFGLLKELSNGLDFTVRDICYFMICISDNTATNMLIDYIGGIDKINKLLSERGYEKTKLNRKMADFESRSKGIDNFTTPEETLKVLENLCKDKEKLDILLSQGCNNKLPGYFFDKIPFAHKTGDLPGIEHDVGRMFFKDREVDIVLLTMDLKDNKDGVLLQNNLGYQVYKNFVEGL